jgi:uncharacterized integral membrane protein
VTDEAKPSPDARGKRDAARIIAAVVLACLLIAFVVDNTRHVTVGFVFADHRTRLIYVLVVTAAVGALLDRLWLRARRKH